MVLNIQLFQIIDWILDTRPIVWTNNDWLSLDSLEKNPVKYESI